MAEWALKVGDGYVGRSGWEKVIRFSCCCVSIQKADCQKIKVWSVGAGLSAFTLQRSWPSVSEGGIENPMRATGVIP